MVVTTSPQVRFQVLAIAVASMLLSLVVIYGTVEIKRMHKEQEKRRMEEVAQWRKLNLVRKSNQR
jgi:2-polyprenyl-3-methyl-5-hydroxy-6-metoxy-1,4-benzoquinol methylase